MNREKSTVGYREMYKLSVEDRFKAFDKISAENRAMLIKTHCERWLAANNSRLSDEQINLINEMIGAISPEWYRSDRDFEKISPEVEALCKRAEAMFSREDGRQLLTIHADYIASA